MDVEEVPMMLDVELGHALEAYVADLVNQGRYMSRSDVLRDGVRLIQAREARLAALDESIHRGLADLEAGRVSSAEEVLDRLEAKYRAA